MPFDAKAATSQFVERLVESLEEIGSTLHLSARSSLSTYSDGNSTKETTITQHLTELESRHRFVVYEAEIDPSPWTAQCVRQADLILLVVPTDSLPSGSRHDALVNYFCGRKITATMELVLLHPGDFDPRVRAEQWLTGLPIRDYYHIVQASKPDFQRLSRFLTGSAVGLVLSGGGARGFAHIGILRALQECGIPVDFIGGTSMGAVIAAQHALGWDWQTMASQTATDWPRCHPQRNYTLPLVALNSGKRMDQMLRGMFGAAEIQNLRKKFFCVSTNLTRADTMIHRTGLLWKAVRASMSIPGVGPPAIENGEIFVDGGFVNNVPVDIMRSLCHGVRLRHRRQRTSRIQKPAARKAIASPVGICSGVGLSPFASKPDLPNIFNILYRTTTSAACVQSKTSKPPPTFTSIRPSPVWQFLTGASIDKIIDAGYGYGLAIFARARPCNLQRCKRCKAGK